MGQIPRSIERISSRPNNNNNIFRLAAVSELY